MDDRTIADRLTNYADALVAVSFFGMSGISIGLLDPDIRCSIARGAYFPAAVGYLASASLTSLLLFVLRRWEIDLRPLASSSGKAARYTRRLRVARFIVVWFSAISAVIMLVSVSRDPACVP